MLAALKKAREGVQKGQTPFGACIVKDGRIIACAHNTVWRDKDVTAHAEINAIRKACRKLKTVDLSGCVIYSTCEPCPMCFSAIHWARIRRIVYGCCIKDARNAGFRELNVSNETMKRLSKGRVRIDGMALGSECLRLLKDWSARKDRRAY